MSSVQICNFWPYKKGTVSPVHECSWQSPLMILIVFAVLNGINGIGGLQQSWWAWQSPSPALWWTECSWKRVSDPFCLAHKSTICTKKGTIWLFFMRLVYRSRKAWASFSENVQKWRMLLKKEWQRQNPFLCTDFPSYVRWIAICAFLRSFLVFSTHFPFTFLRFCALNW
jgi:hypothetical protein